jgi:outer membrane immunogenic protein
LHAGGAFGRSQWNEPGEVPTAPDPSSDLFGLSGGLAGGIFGFQNRNGPWLFGAESDISGGTISGRTSVNCATPCRTSNHWLATVRGKAGYDLGAATPFVTGGLAVGDINANVGGFQGASTVQPGWTVGAGLQMPLSALNPALPDGITGKFEWLHVDLGSPTVCTPRTCGGTASVRFATDILRLGVSIPLSALLPR